MVRQTHHYEHIANIAATIGRSNLNIQIDLIEANYFPKIKKLLLIRTTPLITASHMKYLVDLCQVRRFEIAAK